MRRAIQLAAGGRGHVSPNPMVGAVIVAPGGRVIGEGWHRRFGGPHAEVNAVRSVSESDRALFPQSTIYVTLEPCSHYGKTPPCASLLISCRIGRVVVGAGDPNPKVAGRGIAMLREAGIEVQEHCLEEECRSQNIRFMTAHTQHRPYVTLKWACSSDGFMDAERAPGMPAFRFSDASGAQTVHWRRAVHDAIAVGAGTAIADNPRLDTRLFDGSNPRPIIFDRRKLADKGNCALLERAETLHITDGSSIADVLHRLYSAEGITSLLVEGGAGLLEAFIDASLWDEAFVEVSPHVLGTRGCVVSPALAQMPCDMFKTGCNTILHYLNRL